MTPDDAFAAIDAAVTRSHTNGPVAVVVIHGRADLTVAAAAWWAYRRREDFPRDMYTVDLSEFRSSAGVDLYQVCRVMLRRLGVWPWRIPKPLPALIARYRQRVANRTVLLVLDNADAAEQVHPFAAGLPGSVVLVTSRRKLDGFAGDAVQFVVVTQTSIGPDIDPQEG